MTATVASSSILRVVELPALGLSDAVMRWGFLVPMNRKSIEHHRGEIPDTPSLDAYVSIEFREIRPSVDRQETLGRRDVGGRRAAPCPRVPTAVVTCCALTSFDLPQSRPASHDPVRLASRAANVQPRPHHPDTRRNRIRNVTASLQ